MKPLLLCASLFFYPLLGAAQSQPGQGDLFYLNEKYGFRDATFERPFGSFKNMKLLSSSGHEKRYVRTSDRLAIGEFALKQIAYVFYDNLLSQIDIQVEGEQNVAGVNTAMIANYGPPELKGTVYSWLSIRVRLTSASPADLSKAKLVMLSIPMASKKGEALVEGALKASSDL